MVELAPDLVLANQEENRASDLDALRAAGVPVYVTDIRTLDGAFASLTGCSRHAGWTARAGWTRPRRPGGRCPAAGAAPGGRTDLAKAVDGRRARHVHRCGAAPPRRRQRARRRRRALPAHRPRRLPPHDLVVLPDEPYLFTADDGPEAFPGVPAALVSGRLLTWYGPSLTEAARTLPALLHP